MSFAGDLRYFRSLEQANLPAFVYYVAGVCSAKTSKEVSDILRMLEDLDELSTVAMINDTGKEAIYECLYNGDFPRMTPLLQDYLPIKDSFHLFVDWNVLFPEPKVNCEICLSEMTLEEAIPLGNCGHLFHNECIARHISVQINDGVLQPTCPSCRAPLSSEDIHMRCNQQDKMLLDRQSLSQFLSTHQEKFKHCMTPDCEFAFEYNGETDFECPQCNKRYCLKCMTAFHPQFTCEEYRSAHNPSMVDEMFLQFVRGTHFKQCPNCKFFVEKSMGCNHMTCRCNYQFCYQCGGVYGGCKH